MVGSNNGTGEQAGLTINEADAGRRGDLRDSMRWPFGLGSPRAPLLLAVGFVVVEQLVLMTTQAVTRSVLPFASPVFSGMFAQIAQIVVLVLVLARFGWTSRAGFNTPSHWKQLHLLWFPALVALFDLGPLAQMHAPTVGLLLLAALYALLTGLNEEGQMRGFVLTSLEPLGPLRAAAASAVLFGLVHLNNLLLGGNVGLVALQVPSAALFGFGYAAVRFRTGTIWPLLVVHALTDMATDLFLLSPTGSAAFAGGTGTFSPVVLAVVLLTPALLLSLYGLFLLRPGASHG